MKWRYLINSCEAFSAVVSLILNGILTLLILTKSPKQLGSYKYLMLIISWFEIVYSILDVILSPVFFSTSSIIAVISHPKHDLVPKPLLLILLAMWCGLFNFSMGMFALHFICRYLVASGSTYLKTFEGMGILSWCLIPFTCGGIWGLVAYYVLSSSTPMSDAIRFDVLSYFDWNIDETVYIGPYFYQKQPDGSFELNISSIVSIGVLCLFINSSVLTMTYYGFKCYLKIKKLLTEDTRSQKFNRLQAQLFYALITETLMPVVLMHFPVMVLITATFLNKGMVTISGLKSIRISLFPALDPLPTMFIIKNYRNAIIGMIKSSVVIVVRPRMQSSQNRQLNAFDSNEVL